eukprot:5651662-Pyramimonas_sp.AAC.1
MRNRRGPRPGNCRRIARDQASASMAHACVHAVTAGPKWARHRSRGRLSSVGNAHMYLVLE